MRLRPSARLLILDADNRVLLFLFEHRDGALAGQRFWATPGGGVEGDETFETAAVRELREETGLIVTEVSAPIAERQVVFVMPDGEKSLADERYFLIRAPSLVLSRDGWTELERKVMADHRWWSASDLAATRDQIWPENLAQMLTESGAW